MVGGGGWGVGGVGGGLTFDSRFRVILWKLLVGDNIWGLGMKLKSPSDLSFVPMSAAGLSSWCQSQETGTT